MALHGYGKWTAIAEMVPGTRDLSTHMCSRRPSPVLRTRVSRPSGRSDAQCKKRWDIVHPVEARYQPSCPAYPRNCPNERGVTLLVETCPIRCGSILGCHEMSGADAADRCASEAFKRKRVVDAVIPHVRKDLWRRPKRKKPALQLEDFEVGEEVWADAESKVNKAMVRRVLVSFLGVP